MPYFTTSWLLTFFAHEVENFCVLTRLWDFLLTSHPLKIIHFSTVLIIEMKQEVLVQAEDFGGSSAAFMVFKGPMKFMNDIKFVDKVIEKSQQINQIYP